jgi:hypothetical protein
MISYKLLNRTGKNLLKKLDNISLMLRDFKMINKQCTVLKHNLPVFLLIHTISDPADPDGGLVVVMITIVPKRKLSSFLKENNPLALQK